MGATFLERSYELQGYVRGTWNVIAIFDDRRLSEVEARIIRRSRRYMAVRIREETYDQELASYRSRIIYHFSQLDNYRAPPGDGFSFQKRRDDAEAHPYRDAFLVRLAVWLHAPLTRSAKLDRVLKTLFCLVCVGDLIILVWWLRIFLLHQHWLPQ
jgi:hypothetical protein